ncbi:MAG: hypothetical protein E7L17_10640 [Clostridium sp.]|uniref:hypothetical protein n=1 Tax=Clostridium sp. TaxID=1506 RepID=UPI0029088794|nr:hypothetical protein [Clostridium sp.]MDU7338557.1 hypothetical protein [Clostridium sp.]
MDRKAMRERFRRFCQKTVSFPVLMITVLLFLGLFVGMMNKIDQNTPSDSIDGQYQSKASLSDSYTASFHGDKFQVKRLESAVEGENREKLLLEGTYEHVEENLYFLKASDQTQNAIVVLGKNSFYFYDVEKGTEVQLYRH